MKITAWLMFLVMVPTLALPAQERFQASSTPPAAAHRSFLQKDWAEDIRKELPKWFRFGGQYRSRLEGQTGRQFVRGDDDLFLLSRFRLDLEFRPSSHVRVFIQGQDSHAPGLKTKPRPASFQDAFDLRQSYVEFSGGKGRTFGLKLGRQELSFGEDRLVGTSDWTNTARSFDAARLYFSTPSARVDLFASSIVRIRDAVFNNPLTNGNNFYGIHGSLKKAVPSAVLEPYIYYRTIHRARSEKGAAGSAGVYTFGARLVGQLPAAWDYGVELAGQSGSYSRDRIRAWAGHWVAGYTLKNVRMTPRFLAEYNYASGDKSSADGRRGTFDQLFPTNHNKYGSADQIGWLNIHSLRAGTEMKVRPKLRVSLDYLSHWLAEKTDSLYNAGGAAVARAAGGAGSRHVGQEFDLVLLYSLSRQYTLGTGHAYLWAGQFLKQATAGGNTSYPYIFITYNF